MTLAQAIIIVDISVADKSKRVRDAWDVINAKLAESRPTAHNKQSTPCYECRRDGCGSRGSTVGHCRIFLPR